MSKTLNWWAFGNEMGLGLRAAGRDLASQHIQATSARRPKPISPLPQIYADFKHTDARISVFQDASNHPVAHGGALSRQAIDRENAGFDSAAASRVLRDTSSRRRLIADDTA